MDLPEPDGMLIEAIDVHSTRFPPRVIFAGLRLLPNVKSSHVSMSDLVTACLDIVDCPEAVGIKQRVQEKAITVPTMDWIRKQIIKYDMMCMVYRRWRNKHIGPCALRWLNPDSSPQGGWNYLVIVGNTLAFEVDDALERIRLLVENQVHLEKRSMPSGVMGYGNATLTEKVLKTVHKIALETHQPDSPPDKQWETFDQYRYSVQGMPTDRGHERHIRLCVRCQEQHARVA